MKKKKNRYLLYEISRELRACKQGSGYQPGEEQAMGIGEAGSFLVECLRVKSLQLCLSLCDFMGCSRPGSSVLGILQATILEWVALPSSRGS